MKNKPLLYAGIYIFSMWLMFLAIIITSTISDTTIQQHIIIISSCVILNMLIYYWDQFRDKHGIPK